jgi:non-ribosomal peptide synthetase component F
MKAGGAFVPLDPTAPVSRLRDIIGDTESRIILCSAKYHELCSTLVPQATIVERRTVEKLPSIGTALPAGDPNSPAYLIFTSGSTGKPKYGPLRFSHDLFTNTTLGEPSFSTVLFVLVLPLTGLPFAFFPLQERCNLQATHLMLLFLRS